MRRLMIVVWLAFLAGCGVEVAGTAATVGAARGAEAESLQQLPGQIRESVDAAAAASQNRLEEAERASAR